MHDVFHLYWFENDLIFEILKRKVLSSEKNYVKMQKKCLVFLSFCYVTQNNMNILYDVSYVLMKYWKVVCTICNVSIISNFEKQTILIGEGGW